MCVCVFSVCRLRAGLLWGEHLQLQPSAQNQEDPRSRKRAQVGFRVSECLSAPEWSSRCWTVVQTSLISGRNMSGFSAGDIWGYFLTYKHNFLQIRRADICALLSTIYSAAHDTGRCWTQTVCSCSCFQCIYISLNVCCVFLPVCCYITVSMKVKHFISQF